MLLVSAPAGRVRPLRILVLADVKDAIDDAAARGSSGGRRARSITVRGAES